MFVGERIDKIEAIRESQGNIKGLNIGINIQSVTAENENLTIVYQYQANYADKIGYIRLTGSLFAKEDKKIVKTIKDGWSKNKKLPDDYAEKMLNFINYSGSANGTLVARVLNLSAPLVPPKIQLEKK